MILSAKNNNFRVELSSEFFDEEVIKKYEFVIKNLPSPYKTIRNYINAGIQEFSLPSISLPIVEQVNIHNVVTPWKGKGNMEYNTEKDMNITWKLYEGYLNWFIMQDILQNFYKYTQRKQFMPDIILSLLDNQGYELVAIKYTGIIYYGISELNLSFSSNIPEFNTFTCNFRARDFEILRRIQ